MATYNLWQLQWQIQIITYREIEENVFVKEKEQEKIHSLQD